MSSVNHQEKNIRCYSRQFHTELVKNVLAGFVGLGPATFLALEGILNSLASTVEQSDGSKQTKMIVCEKYEYHKESDSIASCEFSC